MVRQTSSPTITADSRTQRCCSPLLLLLHHHHRRHEGTTAPRSVLLYRILPPPFKHRKQKLLSPPQMSHAPPPQTLPHGWIACHTPDGHIYYVNHATGTSSWDLPAPPPPPPSSYAPPLPPPPSPPTAPAADAFDISGTSVSSLQNFLDPTPDVTCRQALLLLLPHSPGLSSKQLDDMLLANGWEVQHIHVPGLTDHELKLAVRMFTVEQPYPLYRTFNNPFFDKVQLPPPHPPPSLTLAPQNRSPQLLQHHAAYCLLLRSHIENV